MDRAEIVSVADTPRKGSSVLFLEGLWADTLEPSGSYFRLYRLNAPPNRFFGRGDQLQFVGVLRKESLRIRSLPEGLYRAVFWDASADAEDPPAFEVKGPETHHSVALVRPRRKESRVIVHRSDGSLEPEVRASFPLRQWSPEFEPAKSWLRPREPLTDRPKRPPPGGGGGGGRGFRSQGATGLRIGDAAATRGFDGCPPRVTVSSPGASDVTVDLAYDEHASGTWVGLTVPLKEIAASLSLPHGPLISLDSVDIHASSRALPVEDLPRANPWAHLELQVTVNSPGCETLEFTWSPSDGPISPRRMVPSR